MHLRISVVSIVTIAMKILNQKNSVKKFPKYRLPILAHVKSLNKQKCTNTVQMSLSSLGTFYYFFLCFFIKFINNWTINVIKSHIVTNLYMFLSIYKWVKFKKFMIFSSFFQKNFFKKTYIV